MKRRLYIHIGVHRTGTSSLQAFLRANFWPLQARGHLHVFATARHDRLMADIFAGRRGAAAVATEIEARAAAKTHPIRSLTLSDEDICTHRDLAPLAPFRDVFDVKIVVFLRRQDLWLESWYQQNVKWQWNPSLSHLTFADFLDRADSFFWIDYAERLAHLDALFGADNIVIRVFEPGQMPGGPIASFCAAIGLGDITDLGPPPVKNSSFTPLMTEFMRNLPLSRIPSHDRAVIERACAGADARLASTTTASRLFMDRPTRDALMARFAEGNRKVAQRRFGRDRLFLDPLPPPDAPLATTRLPADSYALVGEVVAPFITSLGEEIARLRATRAQPPDMPG